MRASPVMNMGDPPRTRVMGDEYVENITEIVRLAERHGGRGLVLGPVYRDPVTVPDESVRLSSHRARLREAMKKAQLPYVEIERLTEAGWPQNELLFGEKIHPSAMGHELMAESLLQFMARQKMLGDLEVPAF
jgi:hypothetical protein